MCSILMDGKQGVAVEVILGRPVFSSFLTVRATNNGLYVSVAWMVIYV